MTCIVGLRHENKLYFGSDSALSNDIGYLTTLKPNKVFKLGNMLMGVSGDHRLGQVLKYHFSPPKITGDLHEYMVVSFTKKMNDCLKKHDVKFKDSALLLGTAGRIFIVWDDFQVEESADDYHSVGSGCDIARGAMYASQGKPPEERIMLALEAAEKYSTTVRGPFNIDVLDFPRTKA